MKDPRVVKLAKILVGYSTRLQPGENCLVEAFDIPADVVGAVVEEISAAGGVPLVHLRQNEVTRALLVNGREDTWRAHGAADLALMKEAKAYIGLRGSLNVAEMSDVPNANMQWYQTHYMQPVHFRQRVPKTKWVVLRWPSPSFAQQAGMSTRAFEDFYFDVCTMDYAKMAAAMQPLKQVMERTNMVRIKGPGTDLTLSIKGIPAIPCTGDRNIPDGEVFTAPVRNSLNGTVRFNAPTLYFGSRFENVTLEFKNGKAVNATSSDTKRLNEILDSDEGARYLGEFAIGFHPLIKKPMLDILFDEKICGSFHMALGNAYEDAFNGNTSKIHWDLVQIQTPEMGGGEIWFDGVCIRRNGRFVIEELECLNPERLLGTAPEKTSPFKIADTGRSEKPETARSGRRK
ncbi:MAG: aminopeptidase [Planctomycetes bacterium]|nr:aminopeptidase [Planctomycetota bacterium]